MGNKKQVSLLFHGPACGLSNNTLQPARLVLPVDQPEVGVENVGPPPFKV